MREIRFRGKEHTGDWITGGYGQKNGAPHIVAHIVDRGVDEWRAIPVIPATVGQFTGLRDSKGVEIYEGDVLQHQFKGEMTYIRVVFRDATFLAQHWYELEGERVCTEYTLRNANTSKICVIGNIHDNPELLGDAPSC